MRRMIAAASAMMLSAGISALAVAQVPSNVLTFSSGDSVELIRQGPIVLATGVVGWNVDYHPFVPVEDTVRLRAVAGQLWAWLRPQLDSTRPHAFVVLSSTTLRARPTFGISQGHGYRFVLEPRSDGKWYFDGEARPAP